MDRARWTSIGEVIALLVAFTVGVLGAMLVIVTVSPALEDAGITLCCLAVLSLLAGGAAALANHRASLRDHRRRAE